jgi:hypothetical protein
MSFESMLMHELQLDVSKHFDKAWHFCKSFGFKLQPNMEDGLSVILFSMKPDCSIVETKLHGQDTLLSFFDNPAPFIHKSIECHNLKVMKINLYEGDAKQLKDLTVEHNFYVDYQDPEGSQYNLSDLLESNPCYRVALAHHIIQGSYDKDRDFDTCFEMNDGQLVASTIDFIRLRALKPTKENIEKSLIEATQSSLLAG